MPSQLSPNGRSGDPADFAALTPNTGEPERAGRSLFPTAVDSWPIHNDGADEKDFAKYMHDIYCALISVEDVIFNWISNGALHQHKTLRYLYSAVTPNLAAFSIDFPDDPMLILRSSVVVVVRGKELDPSTEWSFKSDSSGIHITNADTIETDDVVQIHYAIIASVSGGSGGGGSTTSGGGITHVISTPYTTGLTVIDVPEKYIASSVTVSIRSRTLKPDDEWQESGDLLSIILLSPTTYAVVNDLITVEYEVEA